MKNLFPAAPVRVIRYAPVCRSALARAIWFVPVIMFVQPILRVLVWAIPGVHSIHVRQSALVCRHARAIQHVHVNQHVRVK